MHAGVTSSMTDVREFDAMYEPVTRDSEGTFTLNVSLPITQEPLKNQIHRTLQSHFNNEPSKATDIPTKLRLELSPISEGNPDIPTTEQSIKGGAYR